MSTWLRRHRLLSTSFVDPMFDAALSRCQSADLSLTVEIDVHGKATTASAPRAGLASPATVRLLDWSELPPITRSLRDR